MVVREVRRRMALWKQSPRAVPLWGRYSSTTGTAETSDSTAKAASMAAFSEKMREAADAVIANWASVLGTADPALWPLSYGDATNSSDNSDDSDGSDNSDSSTSAAAGRSRLLRVVAESLYRVFLQVRAAT